jgi:hypothetical protein
VRVNPLRSHLFWFVIIGASIFAIDGAVRDQSQDIVVDEAVIARIANLWQGQMQRTPTDAELDGLIQDWIDEEMLFREAKRLGLDEDDVIIRRRLVQKIYFIAEESAIDKPTESDLRSWFRQHPDRFQLPERFSFSQVFFNSMDEASRHTSDVVEAGDSWQSLSAPSMINASYRLRNIKEIQTVFGRNFAEAVNELDRGREWHGPIASEFGWHLVRLDDRHASEVPDFDAVRTDVLNDYLYAARTLARDALMSELRHRYDVSFRFQ